jgi:hypothetical protein
MQVTARHWYDQHSGTWPRAACGIQFGSNYTLSMAEATCGQCRAAIQRYLRLLPLTPPTPSGPPFPAQSGEI